jgi:hypothetical protein
LRRTNPAAFGGLGGDPTTGYPYQRGVQFHTTFNYGFHDFEGFPDTHDAGLVILDHAIARDEYGRLAEPGLLKPVREDHQHAERALHLHSGDSGGPVFFGGTTSDKIVSVTSFGMSPWCKGVDFSYRIDQQAVVNWIRASLVSALGQQAGSAEFDKITFTAL